MALQHSRLALVTLGAFILAIGIEHALEPELDPADHMISEYANAPSGAVMTTGFVAWGVSLGLTALIVARSGVTRRRNVVVSALLTIAALGMLMTAGFATQTTAGVLPSGTERSLSGRLHDLGSGTTTILLVAAAMASLGSFQREEVSRRIWVLVLIASSTAISGLLLLLTGDQAPGLRQRCLVAAGCAWQAAFIFRLRALGGGASPRRGSCTRHPDSRCNTS